MFEMMVNGAAVRAQRDEKLIVFLRETLGLTSVKNGCSEGACGTCMVLVDGKATKACVLKTSKCAGKSIVTCEGLSPRERDVYAWAFTSCGAVQCGFCTPGMVISAKGLIDAVPEPDPDCPPKESRMIGVPPSPMDIPGGCRFHPRCPYAKNVCRRAQPELTDLGGGHFAACHFPYACAGVPQTEAEQ